MLEPVLFELASLFALCVVAGVVFQRLRLPPIVGFLTIGACVGPHAIGLVQHEAMVKNLAEVGIVVLLFAVGMEVPLSQLARLRRAIVLGGGVQIVGTVAGVAVACRLAGMSWSQGVFLGFLLSLSSTAAVTKVLVDHGEFASPHGRLTMAIAIAQDLAVVPMILMIPMLVGSEHGGAGGGIVRTLENVALLLLVLGVTRLLLPRALDYVSRTRSRELFVLALATLCLSMAVVTAHLGMSLALGAFLAGMLLADSQYHGNAAAEVEPFRDALASLFFVSIGMLFDPSAIVRAPGVVAVALLAVVAGKAVVIALAARLLGQPGWVRLRAALLLSQVGEFSFVLVQIVNGTGLLPDEAEKIFLVVAVLSIACTPVLHALGRWLVARARARGEPAPVEPRQAERSGHAIVVGYGPTGRTVVHSLRNLGLPVVAVEMNANTVKAERAAGVPIESGDATRVTVLKKLDVERARILVLAVNDTVASRRIVQLAHQLAPQLHIVARVVYDGEVEQLKRAGAHEVVPQELEASVEILVRVLRWFVQPDDEIGRQVRAVRARTGGTDKAAAVAKVDAARIAEFLPGIGVGVYRVDPASAAAGKTLAAAGMRRATGCSVVAVRRGSANLPVVTKETMLAGGDVVVVIGPELRLVDAAATLHAPLETGSSSLPVPPR